MLTLRKNLSHSDFSLTGYELPSILSSLSHLLFVMKKMLRFSLLLLVVLAFASQAQAQNPKISIQGTLKTADGTTVGDGTYNVKFRLYNAINAAEGAQLWEEAATVDVVGGIYSHYLGSITPLNAANFATTLYLGVKVGTYELTPRTELSYSPYSFAVYSTICSGALGDVKHSILNPTQFASVNGACWVPMDGRSIVGSALATLTSMTNVPDAGGLFVRNQEFSGGADQDPDRTSASPIATYQDQAVISHNHGVNDPGHTHSYSDTRQNGDAGDKCGCAGQSAPASASTISDSETTASRTTGISIQNAGGSETRPKNMNLWVYIRIN